MAVIRQPESALIPIPASTTPGFQFGRPRYLRILEELGDTQVGPIWVGPWGFAAVVFFVIGLGFNLIPGLTYAIQRGGNFIRDFNSLGVEPPPQSAGLLGIQTNFHQVADTNVPIGSHMLSASDLTAGGWLFNGGAYILVTLFVSLSILSWMANTYVMARKGRLHPYLFWGLASAAFLYFAIYVIHPLTVRSWADAPPWSLQGHLDWANSYSVKYGNFYYNPFHMLSIIGLLGATMLLGMHGATIMATSKEGSHHEEDEINEAGSGTHKSQLFWRWTMGFNANARTIHTWSFYFATFAVISGGFGVLFSGTLVGNWYYWAVEHSLTACPTLAEVGGRAHAILAPYQFGAAAGHSAASYEYAQGPGCSGLYPNGH